ncbi:uncharacterized protein LOC130805483 [Amaranthus tricolor]|uniref:uncharacterized protein LOC130805483 n=1 Tax=Amaranthus tricolor TaxID=29722 RepID=UPI00258B7E1F|nr:uncharacterized protein LOC130805483 [Amaranthus tricolor]
MPDQLSVQESRKCARENVDKIRKLLWRLRTMWMNTLMNDRICKEQLRLDKRCYEKLCNILQSKGDLVTKRYVTVKEIVAMFLHVLAHDLKNRTIQATFARSGETISRQFHIVLKAQLKLEKYYINHEKGDISTSVLATCDSNLRFTYVLPGWEGSASDPRILRDALQRPNGLKIPRNKYFLVDLGFANAEGFLAPYRGTRYEVPFEFVERHHSNKLQRGF